MVELMNWLIATLYPDRVDFQPFTLKEVIAGRENRLDDPLKYHLELLTKFVDSSAVAGN
jgi:hypothetical protein